MDWDLRNFFQDHERVESQSLENSPPDVMKPDGLLSSEQLLQGSEAERSHEMAGEGEEEGRSLGRR